MVFSNISGYEITEELGLTGKKGGQSGYCSSRVRDSYGDIPDRCRRRFCLFRWCCSRSMLLLRIARYRRVLPTSLLRLLVVCGQ